MSMQKALKTELIYVYQTNMQSLETFIENNWDIIKSSIIITAEETVS